MSSWLDGLLWVHMLVHRLADGLGIHTQGTYPGTDCHHPLVLHHLTLPTLKYIFRLWEAVIHCLLNHYLILNPLR